MAAAVPASISAGRSAPRPLELGRVADAEDDLEDHLEGDRRRPRAQGERLLERPAIALQAEQRGGADERLHHLPANLAGPADGAIGWEHGPREPRLGDVDEPRLIIHWLLDPAATPSADRVVTALGAATRTAPLAQGPPE